MNNIIGTTNDCVVLLCLAFLLLYNVKYLSHAAQDTLTLRNPMGNLDFLDSPNQLFRLSFFNFGDSAMNYLGIQCTIFTEAKIVWVANRENPLKDTPALHITPHGNLLLIGNHGTSITLHSQIRVAINTNTTATLLDIRNFILKAGDNDEILWQRFDYPSNTLFLGMQLGLFDIKSRQARNIALTSWLSPLIPTPGAFRLGIDPNNTN
nr:G-type lectin S-receptor-like serine/threonine-protein kinase At1g67520 [Ziziphus jujuba var. spinosa]